MKKQLKVLSAAATSTCYWSPSSRWPEATWHHGTCTISIIYMNELGSKVELNYPASYIYIYKVCCTAATGSFIGFQVKGYTLFNCRVYFLLLGKAIA